MFSFPRFFFCLFLLLSLVYEVATLLLTEEKEQENGEQGIMSQRYGNHVSTCSPLHTRQGGAPARYGDGVSAIAARIPRDLTHRAANDVVMQPISNLGRNLCEVLTGACKWKMGRSELPLTEMVSALRRGAHIWQAVSRKVAALTKYSAAEDVRGTHQS